MPYYWILFNLFALGMLVLDLRVFHRPGRVARPREALAWSALYVLLAAAFAVVVYFWQGHQAALEFVTGYVLELSLSVDNLFLFLVIFNYFAVSQEQQRRVLFWGILGALAMRGVFIGTGVGLIHRFHWLLYILGALLVYSGIRVCVMGEHQIDPAGNPVVKTLRRWIPVTAAYQGNRFFVRNLADNSRLYATPLLVVLLVIETTDVLFAIDSIPAVLAVTLNAFIVYTSNVFAILGLRSLYFAVSGLMKSFRFLHYGLAVVLVLVGLKMLAADYLHVPIATTLGVVAGVLLLCVLASAAFPAASEGQ
ncbi:MAG TPA: TerC/Alx family metal homeostasis membrane protein [Candidatus Sulfotelmatobacter sp.]|nr:TerC/Alx family metal homeostasis membrane protein [Candidatus Sulfotelmatobacter sp.]